MKRLSMSLFVALMFIQTGNSQTAVEFILTGIPEEGHSKVGIRGNTYPLDWNKSIELKQTGENYSVKLEFPEMISDIEFKFVLFNDDSNPTWESTSNRSEVFANRDALISEHRWNVEQVIDISSLPLIQPDELLHDYELIEQMMLEVHPGTYRYNNKATIQKGLDELKETFQKPLTHGQAYLAMAKLTAAIKCDHTKPGFNNQNKIINSVIHGQPDKLPFTFRWFEGRMLVIQDATPDNILKRGTEVLKINGVEVSKVQDKMVRYIAADGDTDNNRIRKMEINGYDFRYNAFDVFFPLLFPFENGKLHLEVLESGANHPQNVLVNSLTRDERSEILTSRYPEFPKTRDDLWNFEITEDNIGILQVNSFGLMGWKALTIDYKSFLKETFRKMHEEKVQSLIIDIRENNGGNDEMAEELFSYLDIKESVTREIYREGRTRYLTFPEPLKSNVQTWGNDPWFFNLNTDNKKDEYYIFRKDPSDQTFIKKKRFFKGNVFLLTSAQNTSLAYYTALNFKRHGLGTSVGQETGGNRRGINGGQILFLRLPNSGIEIDFSIMGGFVDGEQPNEGVKPDIEVLSTLEQIKSGEDVEMSTALGLIRGN